MNCQRAIEEHALSILISAMRREAAELQSRNRTKGRTTGRFREIFAAFNPFCQMPVRGQSLAKAVEQTLRPQIIKVRSGGYSIREVEKAIFVIVDILREYESAGVNLDCRECAFGDQEVIGLA